MRSLAVLCVLLSASFSRAGDWPRFRGPAGDGITAEKLDLLPEPVKLWEKLLGRGNASLVVQGDLVYTVGIKDGVVRLLCLDADSGNEVWAVRVNSGGADSSPAVEGDRLYLLCHLAEPVLECRSTNDGSVVWSTTMPRPTSDRTYGHAGSPLLTKDHVVVNVGNGAAVKKATGEIAWKFDGLPGLATPVLFEQGEKPAVGIFCGDKMLARDLATGRELWSFPWKTDIAVNACDPIVHDGKVFVNTTYGKRAALFDVSESPPEVVWSDSGSAFSNGFRWKDHVYCFSGHEFVCLDFATGERQWSHRGLGGGAAILAGDKVIVTSDQGRLIVAELSSERFRPLLEEKVHGGTTWTPPSLSNGRLFLRNKDGGAVGLRIGRASE